VKRLLELAKTLRIVEVSGKIGFVLIGAFFAIHTWSWPVAFFLFKIAIYSLICGLAIFCFNSYAGYDHDKANRRLEAASTLSKRQWFLLAIFLSGISCALIYFHPFIPCENPFPIMVTAFCILVLWTLYAMPRYGLKGVPLGGILISFFTEVLLFHLSYLFFAPYSVASIVLSSYFGLLVAAGHTIHELVDYEADKEMQVRTTAVYFGTEMIRYIPFLLFLMAFVLLLLGSWNGFFTLSEELCLAVANLSTLYLAWGVVVNQESLAQVRNKYLAVYSVALMVLFIAKFM
jgi:4-hydroxybenzoate polyprenyltransferase